MGSGVSKLPGRHSDSRVDEVRAELVKGANATASGNSTFTLKLSLQEVANALGGVDPKQQQPKKARTLSLPGSSGSGSPGGSLWGKRGPSTSPIHSIGSLDDIRDEADTTRLVLTDREAASSASPLSAAPSLQDARSSAGVTDDDDDDSSDEIYEDDFEDEISEWKRGDSIGSGSYGTVRRKRSALTCQR